MLPGWRFLADHWFRLVDAWRLAGLPRRHRRNVARARQKLDLLNVWARSGQNYDRKRLFSYLRRIDPYVFEDLVLEAFARAGHRVRRNRRYSGDGGIDGHVLVRGVWCPVQAKRYSGHIDRGHVAAFASLPGRYPVRLFVHTGRTGAAVWDDIRPDRAVLVISGSRLCDLIAGRPDLAEWCRP